MIAEEYLPQDLCQKLVEKGMEIDQVQPPYENPSYCCTQAQAMRWLREEKGLHIEILLRWDANDKPCYLSVIQEVYEPLKHVDFDGDVQSTYEKAAEATIEYVVEHLI